jgi:hypothetical protein
VALHPIGDREGDLGPVGPVRLAFPAGVADDPAVVAVGGDQSVDAGDRPS